MVDIDAVECEFAKEQKSASNMKLHLCQRYSGKNLKDIGDHFGIGESGVSQVSRRVAQRIDSDKKLKRKIKRIEKKLFLSKMKTLLFSSYNLKETHKNADVPTGGSVSFFSLFFGQV